MGPHVTNVSPTRILMLGLVRITTRAFANAL